MRRRRSISLRLALRWISLSLLLSAAILAVLKIREYLNSEEVIPPGSKLGGIPVGGLDVQQGMERLQQAYGIPVALVYGESILHLDPTQAGFVIDTEAMQAAARDAMRLPSGLAGFMDYLSGKQPAPFEIPLEATVSSTRLRDYLESQVASRYDRPPVPALPYPGTVRFIPGSEGLLLDVDQAVPIVETALLSNRERRVQLHLQTVAAPGPSFENLVILLQQTLQRADFDGTAALYLQDLQTKQETNFAYQDGEALPIPPDVAFTAASIIKIPIMVSVFRRLDGEPDPETDRLLKAMIAESGNESADWVMERAIDPERGPLEVTGDMHLLGLENTFLAGFFHLGAPLLAVYETPANRRIDTGIDPDIYNQTTPAEIGRLLADITTCSRSGTGELVETFPGEVTQAECQAMLAYLAGNRTPYLIEAGVPETVEVIHKHGWVSLFEIINTIGDAALVSSPGGDYVLVVYLYHPELLLWDPASALVSSLSQAVFNYFTFIN